jgi:hypothetical protein
VLAIGSRQFMATPEWGGYVANELARRHGWSVDSDTADPSVAYARVGDAVPERYDGWLDERSITT